MSNLKISQLNAAEALTGAEMVEVLQDGANVKTTATAIADLATAASVSFSPEGNIAATNVQAAIEELDAEKLAIADIDDTPVDGATTAPISSNWAYDQNVLLATETDNRVLYDQQLAGGVAYATDLAGQAARGLATAAAAALAAAQGAVATETDNRVLYDEELTRAVTYATDLAGQAARTLSGSLPNNVPASASAPGVAGQMRYASGYLYVCVAANTWQRVAIATWA